MMPGAFRSMGPLAGGTFDVASMLAQALFSACPQSSPSSQSNVTPSSSSCLPSDSSSSSSSETPPVDSSTSPQPSIKKDKVFVLGNVRKFGGKTVRAGLEALLEGQDDKNKKKGSDRTHSKLSAEDTATLKSLLESKDPEVMKSLDTKVPNKKSIIISDRGQILDTVATKDIIDNASLDMKAHSAGKGWDRSAGGTVKTTAGSEYDVAGTELHSPIKINLKGENAQIDGKNGFNIDLNGFADKSGKNGGVQKTSGGLGANEAWLVRDKAGDGIKNKDGVVDGNDVYGDQNGQFKDGYAQLLKDYANDPSSVKTDPKTGKKYIDLTDPRGRAYNELQLLDGAGNLQPARNLLTRIDVDAQAGSAADLAGDGKGNLISARADVHYKNGRVATSADQWYATTA